MSDYRLDRLNTREFEHLTQALCKKFVAVGVTPFGDGPDGGREASFDGKMDFPSLSDPWSGYLVVQCKFRQRSTGDMLSDTEWVTRELASELKKYNENERNIKFRRIPKYYIFVTNAVLSGGAGTGGYDRCEVILREHALRLGIQGYKIWGFDEIRVYLDLASDIRQTYIGFILPDDVLHRALEQLTIYAPDFKQILNAYLQKELQTDFAAKLESAGQHDEKRVVPLAKVFIDLPFTPTKEQSNNASDHHDTIAQYLISLGNAVIRHSDPTKNRIGTPGRVAIVGGPGQGKSTIGQYLCQIYRAALLNGSDTLDPQCAQILETLTLPGSDGIVLEPKSLRFPFRIILNRFASDLAKDESLSIIEYIRRRVEKLGALGSVPVEALKTWIAKYPWIIVFDGLDEVPSSSNRSQVLEQIKHFLIDLTSVKADCMIVSTTRPQGYADEFATSHFQHVYLPPLSEAQALQYGSSLLEFRSNGDEEKFETTRRRLITAVNNEATMHLMSSPLQVTIMATLVERLGEPPKQRYRLFQEYYRTIYTRESNREGIHSELLRDRKTDVDIIHYRTGLLLQAESEIAGKTAALLSLPRFISLVVHRLDEQGVGAEDAARLINDIRDSALDRLVFLVSPQDEEIGFEIRSLQEFMAAEAMVRGTTEEVRKRIVEIAPIMNWRNVFLFMVGKLCDEDSVELIDRIIVLCDELNDATLNAEYASVAWGSRLAIDILLDGATRPSPIRERRLLRVALDAIDFPFMSEARKLASIYHERLEDMYRQKIEPKMAQYSLQRSLPAWGLLESLASKGISWARQLHEIYWPKLSEAGKFAIAPSQVAFHNDWHLRIASEIFPKQAPAAVLSSLSTGDGQKNKGMKSDWPKWLMGIKDLDESLYGYDDDPASIIAVTISTRDAEEDIKIEHVLLAGRDLNVDLFEMPDPSMGWKALFSVLRFLHTPGIQTLALALHAIGKYWDDRNPGWIYGLSPWPLAALLDVIRSPADAERFAVMAEDGQLGDLDDWLAAEGVSQRGVVSYIVRDQPRECPYSRETLKFGLPLAGSYIIARDGESEPLNFDVALEAWREAKGTAQERWASRYLISRLHRISHRKQDEAGSLSFEVISGYIQAVRATGRVMDGDLLATSLDRLGDSSALQLLLDLLASCRDDIVVVSESQAELSAIIRRAALADRLSARALEWARWAVGRGLRVGFSRDQLGMSAAAGSLDTLQCALLRLGAEDLSADECQCLIDAFARGEVQGAYELIQELARAVDRLPAQIADPLRRSALDRLDYAGPIGEGRSLAGSYVGQVCDSLGERRSSLRTSPSRWPSLSFLRSPNE